MANAETVMSVEDFVALVLQTQITGAEEWVNGVKEPIPPAQWKSYLGQAITRDSLQWFVGAVKAQISRDMRRLYQLAEDTTDVLERGREFLQEILAKAERCGIDVSGIKIMPIMAP